MVAASLSLDTTTVSKDWLDGSIVTVLLGNDSSGQPIVLVDQDGDGDLTGEEALTFSPDTLHQAEGSVPILAARTKFTFEYWDAGQIRKRTAPVRLFYTEGAKRENLSWQIMEHPAGTWEVGGEVYRVALGSQAVFRSNDWEHFLIDVEEDGSFDTDPTGLEAYPLSQPFNIGGIAWSVEKLPPGGSHIILSQVDVPVAPRTALREGTTAPVFEVRTVNGDQVSLAELRGKYVLLNFAATWCPFSRAELPFLKEAASTFSSDELIILSLLDDTQGSGLNAYLREFDPGWPQVHQNRTDDIARLYRVLGFPTNYLLNRDGVIVSSGSNLRGDALISTLTSHLRR